MASSIDSSPIQKMIQTVSTMLRLLPEAKSSTQEYPPESRSERNSSNKSSGSSSSSSSNNNNNNNNSNNSNNNNDGESNEGRKISSRENENNSNNNGESSQGQDSSNRKNKEMEKENSKKDKKKKKKKAAKEENSENNDGGESNGSTSNGSGKSNNNIKAGKHIDKLRNDLNYMKFTLTKLTKLEGDIGESIKKLEQELNVFLEDFTPGGSFSDDHVEQLSKLSKDVVKLKVKIPSPNSMSSRADTRRDSQIRQSASGDGRLLDRNDPIFEEFMKQYKGLNDRSKLCLLCFALFPKNAVLKKRLLIYWWVGEGLVDSARKQTAEEASMETAEEIADKIIEELMGKKLEGNRFIEPVIKMGGLVMDSLKMDPLVHSALITHAKDIGFFDLDDDGNPTAKVSLCRKACLVDNAKVPSNEKLGTLFNFNKRFPDFEVEKFSKMKNLSVLYLGRWQSVTKQRDAKKHHIEVESTEFLKGLKYMKCLRLISLQGISRITELPKSMCLLPNLRILDLRACHNLEALPDEISSLKKLTHLDLSECYLLDHMPRGLSSLTELQVLKGFVIGGQIKEKRRCTLDDLKGMSNLRKLSIYAGRNAFPTHRELSALEKLEALQKLKIAWGGDSSSATADNKQKQENRDIETTATNYTNPDSGGNAREQDNGGAAQPKAAEIAKTTAASHTNPVSEGNVRKQDNNSAAQPMAAAIEKTTAGSSANPAGGDNDRQEDNRGAVQPMTQVVEKTTVASCTVPDSRGNDRKLDNSSAAPALVKKTSTANRTGPGSGGNAIVQDKSSAPQPMVALIAKNLVKLDLECFPHSTPPDWLKPDHLEKLKKLYIRGGKLKYLGQTKDQVYEWKTVKILRLKFLNDFMLTWRQRQASFPNLRYLEKVKCPRLAFYPCDVNGEWMDSTME